MDAAFDLTRMRQVLHARLNRKTVEIPRELSVNELLGRQTLHHLEGIGSNVPNMVFGFLVGDGHAGPMTAKRALEGQAPRRTFLCA